jgi:mannosyl-oligosaccharide alpha-1,2-mannosidase
VLPCESAEHCTWNETAYWDYLDPLAATRDHMAEDYLQSEAARGAETGDMTRSAAAASVKQIEANEAANNLAETPSLILNPISLQKRQSSPKEDLPKPVTHNFQDDIAQENEKKITTAHDPEKMKGVSSTAFKQVPANKMYMEKALMTEAELQDMAAGRQAEISLSEQAPTTGPSRPEPLPPLSHKEFVDAKITEETLPPGYMDIYSRKYILR